MRTSGRLLLDTMDMDDEEGGGKNYLIAKKCSL